MGSARRNAEACASAQCMPSPRFSVGITSHQDRRTCLMKNHRQGKPTAVGEVLRRYLAKAGLAPRLAQARVIPRWPELVGTQIAAVTAPESVTPDGTLFVRVTTSPWMNELQLMTPQIMAAINTDGVRPIRRIRWLLSR